MYKEERIYIGFRKIEGKMKGGKEYSGRFFGFKGSGFVFGFWGRRVSVIVSRCVRGD